MAEEGHKLEINNIMPPQQIYANSKRGGAYNQRGAYCQVSMVTALSLTLYQNKLHHE